MEQSHLSELKTMLKSLIDKIPTDDLTGFEYASSLGQLKAYSDVLLSISKLESQKGQSNEPQS